jgi:hypothetical protein
MEITSRHGDAADGASCDPARAHRVHGIVCPPPDAAALGAGSPSADFDRSPTAARNLRLLFQEQRRFLHYFFEHLDYEPVERFAKARCTSLELPQIGTSVCPKTCLERHKPETSSHCVSVPVFPSCISTMCYFTS